MTLSAADILQVTQTLKSKKHNFLDYAQASAKMCIPTKANMVFKKAEGERVDTDLYDSTGVDSSIILAAGMHSFLTSPYSQWFMLGFKKREHQENKELQEWAVKVGEYIYSILSGSNFNRNMAEFYHDLVVMPGATLYKEKDPIDYCRFYTIPFDEVLIAQNARGVIDMVYRAFKYDVYEAFSRWGDKAGPEIADLYSKHKYTDKFNFIHATAPRHKRDVSKKDNKNMPFYSCYVLEEKKRKVEESGYKRNPYYVGRWGKISGQTWGYSPAMVALPDMLMLNSISETNLLEAQMQTSPPWLFPDEDYLQPMNFNPRGINYRTGSPLEKGQMPTPLVSGGNINSGLEMENRRQLNIQKKFFVDLFMINYQGGEKTAYEIAQQAQRQMLVLGSVISDVIDEVLEPALFDVMQDAYEAGELPEVPVDGLNFEDLKFDYISPLAIAQRAAKSQNSNAFLSTVIQMAQAFPTVLDNIDPDYFVREDLAKNHSINPSILRDPQVVTASREAREKMQADANAMQMAHTGGQALKALGEGAAALTPPTREGKKK